MNTESQITTTNDTENNRVVGNKAPFFKSRPRILQKILRGSSEQLEDVDRLWLSNDDIDIYVKYLNEKYGPIAHIMQTTFFYGFLRSCVNAGGTEISDDMALSMQRVNPMIGDFTADIEATISDFIDNYPKKERFKEIDQVSHEETNNM